MPFTLLFDLRANAQMPKAHLLEDIPYEVISKDFMSLCHHTQKNLT